MGTWCKIRDGEVVERVTARVDPKGIATGSDGLPVWRPYERTPQPTFDSATHHPPERLPDTIEDTRVVETWAAPVAKTAQEIDDEKTARATDEATRLLGQIAKRNMATMFAIVNDIRSRHGQPAITVAQFLTFWESSADGISDAQFVAKMKELIE